MTYPFKNLLIVVFLILFNATALFSQQLPAGPQVLTFFSDADDTEQPYGLYLPQHYDPQKKYPLVIMLHGAGSNHRLALRRVFGKSNVNGETDVEATRYFPEWKNIDYIVATPYARGTAGYQGIPEKDVYDVLADVKKRFSIDEDRTYLTGLSMGGGGTLWLSMTRPDIWAAIAPVCPAPPNGTSALAMNARNLPAHFFHGDQDQAVNVAVSRDWVKNLKDMGYQVEYTEYPGVNHNSWENAYKDEAVFDWLAQFKRNRFPDQVRFASTQYKYNHAYWVTFDSFSPGQLATIDAKFTGPNQITITTSALKAFTLQLEGHAQYSNAKPLDVLINGKKLKVPAATSISLKEEKGKWLVGKMMEPTSLIKKQGAEGPIGAVFSSRHIYVYGTGGNPSQEELKARMDVATQAANWSAFRNSFLGRIMFFPRVIADRELRPSDFESANLILFGTRETNTVIEKFSDRLPIQLKPDVKDYGLFYVFPIDNHYVAVNSGLAWWTNAQVQGFPFLPQPYLALGGFKDFILFKDSASNIIADGYFDNNWKFSDADVKKISALPVVTLK
jgi:poly(3-hydroxybutyrate) depolymerase